MKTATYSSNVNPHLQDILSNWRSRGPIRLTAQKEPLETPETDVVPTQKSLFRADLAAAFAEVERQTQLLREHPRRPTCFLRKAFEELERLLQ